MSGIVLQATAFKITNKGGGVQRRIDYKKGEAVSKTDTGSDYIGFYCANPRCGHRNKMCMFESEGYFDPANDRIPFKCRMCRTVIEVTRPAPTHRIVLSTDVNRNVPQHGKLIIP